MVDKMGLDLSLRTAMSGLRTVQKGLDTVSSNIANADTAGYTRKVLTQSTVVMDGKGLGVQTGNIEREVDTALQRETLTQESRVSNLKVLDQYLGQVEMLHGDPEQETSLGNVVNQMRDGFAKLMDSPSSVPLQNEVISQADNLARTVNRLADGLNTIRTNVQGEIVGAIDDINTQFQTIDELNRKIRTSTALGQTEPDLEDKRDEAVRLVAEQIDINVMKRSDGSIAILDHYGQPLLEDTYKPLSINNTAVISPQVAYPGGIAPIRLGDPATGTDVTGMMRGGRLGGLLELRDQALPRYQAQLDEFATTLAETFSNSDLTLFTNKPGTEPVKNVPISTPIGYSNQMQVSQIVRDDPRLLRDGDDGTSAGAADSTLLRSIVDGVLGSPKVFQTGSSIPPNGLGPNLNIATALPGSADFASFATELVSYQVNQRANATAQLQPATSLRDQLKIKLSDQSGVNLDTEVSLLIQLQRSYSSSAQVVSTNRQMFNDLISIVR
jgi:flagellar hook-associated protein 1 FlgK